MTLLTCDQVRDSLPDALAGTLGAEEAHVLFAHLAGCADCRAEGELLQVLRRHGTTTPVGLEARILAAAGRKAPWWARATKPALLAAGLAGAAIGGAALLRHPLEPGRPVARAATPAPPTTAAPLAVTRATAPAPAAGDTGRGTAGSAEMAVAPAESSPDLGVLAQPLPGSAEVGLFAGGGEDLSEDELQTLLKELQS